MNIRDADGTRFVSLEPVSYQFGQKHGDPYDDNWLVIKGSVRSDSESWTFREACLLVGEAQELASWLGLVAAGEAVPMGSTADGALHPTTEHIEPNIGFGLVHYAADYVVLRVFLWLESGPPSARVHSKADLEWFMDVDVRREDLAEAASQFKAELERFPQRL